MNTRWKMKSLLGATLVLLVAQTQSILACAACYGQSDSPMARGMNWGILSLMTVVGFVLSSVVVFFVHIGRRSAVAGRAAAPDEPPVKKV